MSSSTFAPSAGDGAFFLIGRDAHGAWLAVETHGQGGGLFTSREAALAYVRREVAPMEEAFAMTEAPLDLVFPASKATRRARRSARG